MSTPASRSLERVLVDALSAPAGLRLLVGTFTAPAPADTRYARVTIDGAAVVIPRLKGAAGTTGQVAYVLADQGRMLVIGTVAT